MNAELKDFTMGIDLGTQSVELLDAGQMAELEGGNIPMPPLWVLAGGAAGLWIGAVAVGVAVYYYQTH